MKLREVFLIAGIIFLLSSVAYAFFAYESVTVSYTAKSLTASTYQRATHAYITVEGNGIRWTMDAVNTPTSAGVGHNLASGATLTLITSDEIRNFQAVREDSDADAILKVTYRGY